MITEATPIGRMQPYGTEHVVVLIVVAVASVLAALLARRGRIPEASVRTFGWVLLVAALAWTLWGLLPAHWEIGNSLPFHLSDWLRFVAAIALITRWGWAVVVTYYWGLTLNLQAFLTPDLAYFHNPPVEFLMFWLLHGAVFVAPVLLVWGLGHRPTWRGFAAAYGITLVWAATAMTVNATFGTNYGFIAHPPRVASVIDVLGPWPWYVVSLAGVLAVMWALMTWPWTTRRARAASRPDKRTRLMRTRRTP